MDDTIDSRGWDSAEWPLEAAPSDDWQDTIDLLKLVQEDYAGARQQLQVVSETLASRQAVLSERLRYALLESTGHSAMCLVPYRIGAPGSALGRATLGFRVRERIPTRRSRFEARCLGRFELSWDGKTISKWQSAKAKAVLEYLMTRPREPVVKDVLMEALWPGCDSQSANNNLKAAVHGLRQTLNSAFGRNDLVKFVQGSYSLNPDIQLWVDVEQLEQHWSRGRRFEREGRFVEAVHEFELAQTLYRGDYLQDERYEEWTLLRREALKDTCLAIISKLAEYALQAEDYEGCVVSCQKILSEDPCREDAYRWLMCSYSRLGHKNRALRWYEMCCRAMKAEFDSVPGDESQALYRRLVANEPI